MNRMVILAGLVLLSVHSVPAQTPSRLPTKAVAAVNPEDVSSAEMNIRAYIELLRTDVKKSKSQIMGDVMLLDADQAAKFWPAYQKFQAELSVLGDRVVALVRDYADHYDSMTDDVADKLANEILGIERQRNQLKKKYYDRMKDELGAITATRFLQVENQLERLVDLQIAAQLPIVSQQ